MQVLKHRYKRDGAAKDNWPSKDGRGIVCFAFLETSRREDGRGGQPHFNSPLKESQPATDPINFLWAPVPIYGHFPGYDRTR